MSDSTLTLLLVEDNDIDVFMMQRLMRRLSLDNPIIRARNGEEALAILCPANANDKLPPPFIMLLDINMPRMDGFELLEALSNDAALAQIPIYILSTSSSDMDKAKAKAYRTRGYVVKPLTSETLLNILQLSTGD